MIGRILVGYTVIVNNERIPFLYDSEIKKIE